MVSRTWIYLLHPPRPYFAETMSTEEGAVFAEHFAYLERLRADGVLLIAGPTLGETNTGIAVFRADDEEAARTIMDADPVVRAGIATAELREFRASLTAAPRTWVFGYGSLVYRASIEATIERRMGDGDGPLPARLLDHRLAWNVVGPTEVRPDYRFSSEDGAEWQGDIAWLGVEAAPDAVVPGAVWRVTETDLVRLDDRERGYLRLDITPLVECAGVPAGDRIVTYAPRPRSAANAERLRGTEPAPVVMARYLALLDAAFSELGPEALAEHRSVRPDPTGFRVAEIGVAPRDPARANAAIEPRQGGQA